MHFMHILQGSKKVLIALLTPIIVAVFFSGLLITLPGSFSWAEETIEQKETRLKRELIAAEEAMLAAQRQLHAVNQEKSGIEKDIAVTRAEINAEKATLQRLEITIEALASDIKLRSNKILELGDDIDSNKQRLALLIQENAKKSDFSLVEMLLSEETLSEFLDDMKLITDVRQSLKLVVEDLQGDLEKNDEERTVLGKEKDRTVDARSSVAAAKAQIEKKEAELKRLLAIKDGEAQGYSTLVAEKQRQAAEIRAALFALRDTASIPFGKALEYANNAYRVTGVRPAFLLAILKQESNLGQNVGTCNRPGDPPEKHWTAIMPGPNDGSWRDDQTSFKQITSQLGISPEGRPLSCPLGGYGWGGAMGPAQFIPATWLQYQPRIATAVGVSVPNPWNPEHAFMASALYLRDLGAAGGGYTAERTAALKYYSGSNWQDPRNQFYGDGVMAHAADIQTNMIEPLQNL